MIHPFGLVSVWCATWIVLALEKVWVRVLLTILFFAFICIFALLVGEDQQGLPPYPDHFGTPWSTILFWSAIAAPIGYVCIVYRRGRRLLSAPAGKDAVCDFRCPIKLDGKLFRTARITLYDSYIVIATAFKKIQVPLHSIKSVEAPVRFPVTVLHIKPSDPETHPLIDIKCIENPELFKMLAKMVEDLSD